MHTVTSLATLHQLSKQKMFNLESYLICKPFLAQKDKQIAKYCQNIIENIGREKKQALYILDVGSGEASQIEKIIDQLHSSKSLECNNNFPLTVDCVEPEQEACKYIRQMIARVNNKDIGVTIYEMPVEELIATSDKKYNAILCIHSLYHISKANWHKLLHKLFNHLQPGGVLIINLVSKSSDIYQYLDQLMPYVEDQMIRRTYDSDGWLYFAEDVEAILQSLNAKVNSIEISVNISFPSETVFQCALAMQDGSLDKNEVIKFFAFMFRIYPDDLIAIGKNVLLPLVTNNRGSLTFKSVDRMFVVQRIKNE